MDNLSLRNNSIHSNQTANGGYNGQNNNHYSDHATPTSPHPPQGHNSPPPQANWAPLAQATALYAYSSPDAGDLQLQPNDHITVTEYMNAEWWKGRSSRTGQEGIFPRSYVQVVDEKGGPPPGMPLQGTDYGNMPMQVANGGNGNGPSRPPGKAQEMGVKFGKKLGNAAIFGAGMTIGSDVVNAIL